MQKRDEQAVLREQNMRLRARLLDVLRGPWNGTGDIARTAACVEMNHPIVQKNGDCACGMRLKGLTR